MNRLLIKTMETMAMKEERKRTMRKMLSREEEERNERRNKGKSLKINVKGLMVMLVLVV